MIEVEKKFFLTDAGKQALIRDAELAGTKTFKDVYYDTHAYDLTRKGMWLRLRDKRWELKIPLGGAATRAVDQYRELETEPEIADFLTLRQEKVLAYAMQEAGYVPFAAIVTTRTKYKKDGFTIDLDSTDFGYELAEIERMVSGASAVEEATSQILAFAKKHKLKTERVRGKVIEYLRRNNKAHFNALVEAGVVVK